MNRFNIVSNFTNRVETRYAGIALAALLGAALSSPAHADETWKIRLAKSHFSPGANTLILHRDSGKATTQGTDAKGNPAAGTFVVISNGKVYLATDEATTDAVSNKAVKTVDYSRWRGMKLVQIGDRVQSPDHCGFECQGGFPTNRMALTFKATGGDVSGQMSDVAVLNTR